MAAASEGVSPGRGMYDAGHAGTRLGAEAIRRSVIARISDDSSGRSQRGSCVRTMFQANGTVRLKHELIFTTARTAQPKMLQSRFTAVAVNDPHNSPVAQIAQLFPHSEL
jgi:hypothetical protein